MQTGVVSMLTKVAHGKSREELKEGESIVDLVSAYIKWVQGKLNDTVAFLNASTNGSDNVDILKMKLELPEVRALQCARFLEYCDSRFQSFTYHNVGAGARKVMCDFLNIPAASRKHIPSQRTISCKFAISWRRCCGNRTRRASSGGFR